MRNAAAPKPRKVNFVLIPLDRKPEHEAYRLMGEIRDEFHPDIHEAKIALAWRTSLKKDSDGHLMLGKCIKTSDLAKEFSAFDFIILLNREVWEDMSFTAKQKRALLDHELCHADVSLDKEQDTRRDERGRQIFRVKKHDIEEFRAVVERHGCYKHDLEDFAKAILRGKSKGLFAEAEELLATHPATHLKARKTHTDGKSAGAQN